MSVPTGIAAAMKINFVMPPIASISGGPLAILEYANRFLEAGHVVSITTYPDTNWSGDNPYPWFKFKGELHYKRLRGLQLGPEQGLDLSKIDRSDLQRLSDAISITLGPSALRELVLSSSANVPNKMALSTVVDEALNWLYTMEVMPDCDINIATFWSTAFPVYFSGKGKPVFFMQHLEEVFYPIQNDLLLNKILARSAYSLPLFKIANSSWLRDQIKLRYGQNVPFSTNAIEIGDFNPRPKTSETDGVIRLVTYARPEDWKGFADAVAAVSQARSRLGGKLQWNVFGYKHPVLTEQNAYAPYVYHPKLSFAALADLYATSDIALCPSWYESFPLPPLEAMASGTATITTGAGTEDYAFDGDNAWVVGSRDTTAMADAICRLATDPSLRSKLATNGRKTAERYTWSRAASEREALLLDIHEGRIAYNPNQGISAGLADVNGIAFERAPLDITDHREGLYWNHGALFLFKDGVRHHVTEGDLIPLLIERGYGYVDVSDLDAIRIPAGRPICTPSDIH
ncbi:glycosyltransferase family 4 protein [Methylobacterium persicinum]|uniref:Glycosyltransferase involved in cell wall biosynthesis n=1 Tax=Methylobacterium persicinum TaxID=374426 RepID=A0ABU0HL19_9HYPH|nr:glycosyltransferase family 4 protein [Methylobacterium persicinum]MDQ0443011.1 glycosyltransferase involved in cell wall biosynthesis [Methylobacterium persicinum]